MTAVQLPPTVDTPAADQLATDAQRAGLDDLARIVRTGGPTAIHFTSRTDYQAWADFGLIAVDPSPARTTTVGRTEVHVPVTFGWPVSWAAVAIYPTQDACTCRAERVHMAGCPADTLLDGPECPGCGVLGGSHQTSCYGAVLAAANAIPVVIVDPTAPDSPLRALDGMGNWTTPFESTLPQRVPGAYDSAAVQDAIHATIARDIVHYRTPDEWTACGHDPRGTDTRHADRATCPDCLAALALPQRTPGALLGVVALDTCTEPSCGGPADRPGSGICALCRTEADILPDAHAILAEVLGGRTLDDPIGLVPADADDAFTAETIAHRHERVPVVDVLTVDPDLHDVGRGDPETTRIGATS